MFTLTTQHTRMLLNMLGLAYIHCSDRGVVWKVNMAFDVQFNQVNDLIS